MTKTSTITPAAALLAVLCLGPAASARADSSECDAIWGAASGIHMRRVTYLGPFSSIAGDRRADPGDPSHTVELRGWLYFKEGVLNRDRPVVVFNHGHEKTRSEPCAIAKFFVNRGFVVFAPLRRGHEGQSGSSIRSTGVHTDDYVSACLLSGTCSCSRCDGHAACPENALEVDYIRQQYLDVWYQLLYIKGQDAIAADLSAASGRLADPTRIAIVGHSFGGSLVVFANARIPEGIGQSVVVDISGAELSWGPGRPFWESELSCAMSGQRRPIYFLQPRNGRTLEPTRTLFPLAIDHGYRSQAAIFAPAPWDPVCAHHEASCWDASAGEVKPEWKQAHGSFVRDKAQVEEWGPSVIEFIERHPCSACAF